MSWCWPPFGSHFGGVSGAQMEAKAINKPLQKNIKKKWCPTWAQTDPKWGPKMEPKSSNMRSWKHLVSRVAVKWPPEPLQDQFWKGVGTIFGLCSSVFVWHLLGVFCQHFLAACCKQKCSNSQGITKIMQQRASKKQLLSSCHLALKSSLANVNELSGPC